MFTQIMETETHLIGYDETISEIVKNHLIYMEEEYRCVVAMSKDDKKQTYLIINSDNELLVEADTANELRQVIEEMKERSLENENSFKVLRETETHYIGFDKTILDVSRTHRLHKLLASKAKDDNAMRYFILDDEDKILSITSSPEEFISSSKQFLN